MRLICMFTPPVTDRKCTTKLAPICRIMVRCKPNDGFSLQGPQAEVRVEPPLWFFWGVAKSLENGCRTSPVAREHSVHGLMM